MHKDRFDLEQEILSCWGVTDDIQLIIGSFHDMKPEELLDTLKAIKTLYELKFNKAFGTFERCIYSKDI